MTGFSDDDVSGGTGIGVLQTGTGGHISEGVEKGSGQGGEEPSVNLQRWSFLANGELINLA